MSRLDRPRTRLYPDPIPPLSSLNLQYSRRLYTVGVWHACRLEESKGPGLVDSYLRRRFVSFTRCATWAASGGRRHNVR